MTVAVGLAFVVARVSRTVRWERWPRTRVAVEIPGHGHQQGEAGPAHQKVAVLGGQAVPCRVQGYHAGEDAEESQPAEPAPTAPANREQRGAGQAA